MNDSWNWDALLNAAPPPRMPQRDKLHDAVAEVLLIRTQNFIENEKGTARQWQGSLRVPAEEALNRLIPIFAGENFTAMIQQAEQADEVIVLATPGVVKPDSSRLWLALLLFVLTIISTVVTGASEADADGNMAFNWSDGLMYSASILSILLAHEMGHFIAARRMGVAVSYPFFIPMPLVVIFGTMGAFIQMKALPPNRRALFMIAVSGPLAGLALAIPLTFFGLYLSNVQPLPVDQSYFLEGNNLLYGTMKLLIFGQWLPNNGVDVFLHPIAWAGWAGMLVTMLNLLPAGQLDGGHVVFALLGRRWGQAVTRGVIGVLFMMGFVWNGWWVWALMVMFLGKRHVPILNDVTPLTKRQQMVALLVLLIFVLLFTPTPLTVVE